ncbi:MAG: hypothetical protein PVI23_15570 [Maricaulaceae bacterium]|jgi:hypothetical protein
MDQLINQAMDFVQTPVGMGVAVVAALIVLFIIRKLLSLIFLIAGLGVLGWAGLRYSDVISFDELSEPSFVASAFNAPPPGAATAEAAAAPAARSLSADSADAPSPEDVRELPIHYNRPSQMGLERPTTVSLVVDATGEGEGAALLEGFVGEIISGQAELTPNVSATLTGPGFDVEAQSPLQQRLSDQTENIWTWQVTPTQEGEQVLTLQIYSHPGDAGAAQPVAAYTDRITVHVSRFGLILALANRADPLIGVAAGSVSLLLALFGILRRRRHR